MEHLCCLPSVSLPFIEADNFNPNSWLYVAMFRYPQELGDVGGSRLDGGSAWGVGGGLFRPAGQTVRPCGRLGGENLDFFF
jgi:hypothetical protein